MMDSEEIQQEINKNPLVGKLEELSSLDAEYKANPKFLRKIADAKKNYTGLRRVRGDGSCFYRSYLFAYLERLLTHREEIPAFLKTVKDSFEPLVKLGAPRYTLEDFHDALVSEVEWIAKDQPTPAELLQHFNDENSSSYLTYYCRALVSGYLKAHVADFEAYLPPGKSMAQFIQSEVDPVIAEADYIQCTALTQSLGVGARIEYLDQSEGALNGHVLPSDATPKVFLLYRPGHYDILYPKSDSKQSSSSTPSPSSSSSSSSSPSSSTSPSAATTSSPTATTATTPTTTTSNSTNNTSTTP
eukprot:gb/GEZN01007518.1/.p1 GENE.gb/GEZN01007518.1/~~gb/GEZN01007518.1/.p1  ORF type:complete len:310 (-),score=67.76 gb/GEZN01007518.1/:601-1503(-)